MPIFYGQTPGYRFNDWIGVTNQQWNDPEYWKSAGIQQWGPEPPAIGDMMTGDYANNLQSTWNDWMQTNPVAPIESPMNWADVASAEWMTNPVPGMGNAVVDMVSDPFSTPDSNQFAASARSAGSGDDPWDQSDYDQWLESNPRSAPAVPQNIADTPPVEYSGSESEFMAILANNPGLSAEEAIELYNLMQATGGVQSATPLPTIAPTYQGAVPETPSAGGSGTDTESGDIPDIPLNPGDDTLDWMQQYYDWISDKTGVSTSGQTATSDQYASTGISDPAARNALSDMLEQMAGATPQYAESMSRLSGLPSEIDQWTNDLVSGYRTRNEDIVRAMQSVANQRGAQNILRGTESENLRANTMAALADREQQQRNAAMSSALGLKAQTVAQTPSAMRGGVSAVSDMLNLTDKFNQVTNTADSHAWGDDNAKDVSLAMNMFNSFLNLMNLYSGMP